jgi:hypothetical protein
MSGGDARRPGADRARHQIGLLPPGIQSDHLFNALFDVGDALNGSIPGTSRAPP